MSPADLQGVYFSKTFNLDGQPVAGSIRVAADDFAEVSINGAFVGSTGSITNLGAAGAAQSSLVGFDLTPFLVPGPNTITIRAQNGPYWFSGVGCNPCSYGGNPAGLVFAGELRVSSSPTYPACAAQVVDFAPGALDFGYGLIDPVICAGISEPLDASCMLGPPDRHVCSIGELGSITVQFNVGIWDGPGDDVVVWGSCNAANEPGLVLASDDGVTFAALGRFDAGVSMGFDLGVVGLSSASIIRIQDLPGGVYPEGSGVDIDAICALNVSSPVPAKRASWGQLKGRYR